MGIIPEVEDITKFRGTKRSLFNQGIGFLCQSWQGVGRVQKPSFLGRGSSIIEPQKTSKSAYEGTRE